MGTEKTEKWGKEKRELKILKGIKNNERMGVLLRLLRFKKTC